MSALGLVNWSRMILALTATITLVLILLGLAIMRQTGPARVDDAALRLWNKAMRRLRRLGLTQRPDEGAQTFTERVCAKQPALAPWMRALCAAYLRARYLEPEQPQSAAALAQAARAPSKK